MSDTSGPAFPINANESADRCIYTGMTLRDYFAAKAMAAMVIADEIWSIQTPHNVAIAAYACADAMLAERAK